jgi:hypothetical protein
MSHAFYRMHWNDYELRGSASNSERFLPDVHQDWASAIRSCGEDVWEKGLIGLVVMRYAVLGGEANRIDVCR